MVAFGFAAMAAAPATPEAYVAALPPARREEFEALLALVRGALPGARETMGYRMPTFEVEGVRVCAAAAQKRHLALYVCESSALERHRQAFAHLDLGRGCIRFRSLDELPRKETSRMLREAGAEAGA